MKSKWKVPACAAILAALSLVCAGPAGAVTIAVFDNPSFVDTFTGGVSAESDNVQASLASLGHTVNTFTGVSASDFTAVGAAADLLLFPEFEVGSLNVALDAAARNAIADYVSGGGAVIVMGHGFRDLHFLNAIFGYSLVSGAGGFADLDAAAAAGTPFADDAATLPNNNAVTGVLRSSLPAGVLDLYHGSGANKVFAAPYGDGAVIRLGWDWYSAKPLGGQDSGWIGVLDSAVEYAASHGGGDAQPVSEPASLALIGAGLMGLAFVRRHRVAGRPAAA